MVHPILILSKGTEKNVYCGWVKQTTNTYGCPSLSHLIIMAIPILIIGCHCGIRNRLVQFWSLIISIDDVHRRLVLPDTLSESDISEHQFCITIFNNPEGERIHLYELLNSYKPVIGYGRPFNNWFPTYEDYKSKLKTMSGYLFNLCPENSYQPGYYTEKCIHSKLARTCPIYKADSSLLTLEPIFLNLYDYRIAEDLLEHVNFWIRIELH